MHFDSDKELICDCSDSGVINEHIVSLQEDGSIVILCPDCNNSMTIAGGHIADVTVNEVPDPIPENVEMTITDDQAKYWFTVAKKDLSEGNKEGAWNVFRWLKENNATDYASKLRDAIVKSRSD